MLCCVIIQDRYEYQQFKKEVASSKFGAVGFKTDLVYTFTMTTDGCLCFIFDTERKPDIQQCQSGIPEPSLWGVLGVSYWTSKFYQY